MAAIKHNRVISLVLAAGQGKRMENKDLPKVLALLDGKPLIRYVLDAVRMSGVSERTAIVVGFQAEKVMAELGSGCDYVLQAERRGTGHAVMCAEAALKEKAEHVLVLYGDMPLVTADTVQRLVAAHHASDSMLTMATMRVEDFNDWRQGFASFGRVLRSSRGDVEASVEAKDATPEQLKNTECNPCLYCFNAAWLWDNIKLLKDANAQGEYYLTDLIAAAKGQGHAIATIEIDPRDAFGINTPHDLAVANQLQREQQVVFA